MHLGGVEKYWAAAVSAVLLTSGWASSAAAQPPDEDPQPIYREVVCAPVTTREFAGARIGPEGSGSIVRVSSIGIRPKSPYHYSAEGRLYAQFEAGKPMITLEVVGNYYEWDGLSSATLHATSNPEISVIHLDFLDKKNNGSFIETRSGPIFRMDCSRSPEFPQHTHE